MPPYTSPEKGSSMFGAKFVRLGERIITTKPNDIATAHDRLVVQEGMREELDAAIERDNVDVDADAGIYYVFKDRIELMDISSNLALPAKEAARDRSVTVFQEQSPGFNVQKE